MNKKLILLILLVLPFSTQAHGLVTTLTQIHDPYTIEFEYNTIGNIKANTFNIFNVYLLDASQNTIDFDSVYIKISDDKTDNTELFGTVKESVDIPGTARIGGVISKAGEYVGEVQFSKDGKQIGPYEFKFTVDSEITNKVKKFDVRESYIYVPGILSLVGFTTALVLKLRNGKKKR
jgi:hypothetical protein